MVDFLNSAQSSSERYRPALCLVGVLCVLVLLLLATGVLGDGLHVKVVAAKSGMSDSPYGGGWTVAANGAGSASLLQTVDHTGSHDPYGRSGFRGRRSSGFGGYEPPVFWNPGDLAVIGADQDAGIRAEEAGAIAYGSAEHGVLARRKTAADWAVQGAEDRVAYRYQDPIIRAGYAAGMSSSPPVMSREHIPFPEPLGVRVSGMEDNFGARLSPY